MLWLFLKAEVYVIIIPKCRSICCNYSEVNVIIIPEGRNKSYNYS